MSKITLYYDIVSPYSWLAFEVFNRYQSIWNIPIVFQPFSLGGVMKLSSNTPPASNPFKAVYLPRDLERNKHFFKVNLNFPSKFPVSTIKAQRVLLAIQRDHPDKLVSCTRALWSALWEQNQDVSQWQILSAHLKPLLQKNYVDSLESLIETKEIKDSLTSITAYCVNELGAFGAPWIHIQCTKTNDEQQEHVFFGSDRFEIIAHLLNKPWYGPNPHIQSKI